MSVTLDVSKLLKSKVVAWLPLNIYLIVPLPLTVPTNLTELMLFRLEYQGYELTERLLLYVSSCVTPYRPIISSPSSVIRQSTLS